MDGKFVLKKKRPLYRQCDCDNPKINIPRATYNKLAEWCDLTGHSMSYLASKAIECAEANLVWEGEEE